MRRTRSMKLKSIVIASMLIFLVTTNVFANKVWEKEQLEGSKQFVLLGYGDLREKNYRSLNFVTECLKTDQMSQIIPIVTQYNAFDGKKIAEALKQFRGKISCYEFGRAGSPILHIDIPYWTHQLEYYDGPKLGRRITEAELEKLIKELKRVFQVEHFADDFGRDSIMERKIYFWWD